MKKFFAKKWTLIGFVIASAIFLGGLLAMLLSPVFYVGAYSGGEGDDNYSYKYYIHFKSCNKYEVTREAKLISNGTTTTTVTEYWYYRQGDVVISIDKTEDMTKEQYDKTVKEIKDLSEEEFEVLVKTRGSKINLRYMEIKTLTSSVKYSNKSSITFLVIDSILLGLALTGTGLSIFYYVKAKKKKSKN